MGRLGDAAIRLACYPSACRFKDPSPGRPQESVVACATTDSAWAGRRYVARRITVHYEVVLRQDGDVASKRRRVRHGVSGGALRPGEDLVGARWRKWAIARTAAVGTRRSGFAPLHNGPVRVPVDGDIATHRPVGADAAALATSAVRTEEHPISVGGGRVPGMVDHGHGRRISRRWAGQQQRSGYGCRDGTYRLHLSSISPKQLACSVFHMDFADHPSRSGIRLAVASEEQPVGRGPQSGVEIARADVRQLRTSPIRLGHVHLQAASGRRFIDTPAARDGSHRDRKQFFRSVVSPSHTAAC